MQNGKKNKGDVKGCRYIVVYCNRLGLELIDSKIQLLKTKATYSIDRQNAEIVCQWIKTFKLSNSYASNISNYVDEDYTVSRFKGHDCHAFLQKIMSVVFRDLIPNPLWNVITKLCHYFGVITSTSLVVEHSEQLEKNILLILCKLEKNLPPNFFDSIEHLPIHLAYKAWVCGPPHYQLMYPFKRFIQYLKKKVSNKNYPEGSMCELYLVEEVLIFCAFYFEVDIAMPFNQPPQNNDDDPRGWPGFLSLFSYPGHEMPLRNDFRSLIDEELHIVHTYVFLNCEEVGPHFEFVQSNSCSFLFFNFLKD